MRTSEVVHRAADYLARHDVESPRPTAEQLLMAVLGIGRAEIYLGDRDLSTSEARRFGRALCRRCSGTPTQHLTGEQGFRRLILEVRPGVFIPRPETEVLVEVALQLIEGIDTPWVADVGTGTGAVALAIKDEHPGARVVAIDLSAEAVALARANAERLRLDVTVLQGDLLEPLPPELRGQIDLVVSNPPYVGPDELGRLSREVRADPSLALLGDIDLYRRLFAAAAGWLRPQRGAVAVEIGETMGDSVAAAAAGSFSGGAVAIVHDLAGRPRVFRARLP